MQSAISIGTNFSKHITNNYCFFWSGFSKFCTYCSTTKLLISRSDGLVIITLLIVDNRVLVYLFIHAWLTFMPKSCYQQLQRKRRKNEFLFGTRAYLGLTSTNPIEQLFPVQRNISSVPLYSCEWSTTDVKVVLVLHDCICLKHLFSYLFRPPLFKPIHINMLQIVFLLTTV